MRWFKENVMFVSWWSMWKGVYIHCLSRRWTYRVYWSNGRLSADRHARCPVASGLIDRK